jgi:hypothetical protein
MLVRCRQTRKTWQRSAFDGPGAWNSPTVLSGQVQPRHHYTIGWSPLHTCSMHVPLHAVCCIASRCDSHFGSFLPCRQVGAAVEAIYTYPPAWRRLGWHHDDVAIGVSKESTTWNHRVNNCRTEAEGIPCFCVKPVPRALEMKRTSSASARSWQQQHASPQQQLAPLSSGSRCHSSIHIHKPHHWEVNEQ